MKLEKLNESYFVFADNNKEVGSFQLDSDGSYYFWINDEASGCWTAQNLKEIAELLDEVNKSFDKEVDEYFDLLRRNKEDAARIEYRKLLNNGMFFEFYPNLTGNWKEDKLEWFDEYKKLEELRSRKEIF